MPTQTSLVVQARRLVTTSIVGPFSIYVLTMVTMYLSGQPVPGFSTFFYVSFAMFTFGFGFVGVWIYRGVRNIPTAWTPGGCFYGIAVGFYFLLLLFRIRDPLQLGLSNAAFAVAVVTVNTVIALVGWLPARRAAHLVLNDLLAPDVVNSTLAVKFTARGKKLVYLRVMLDSVKIEVGPGGNHEIKRSYPLAEVASVAVRTEISDGEYPVPGAKGKKPIQVTPGDVVVIELPDGDLVFPAKEDAQRVKRFIDERGRAVVAGG